VGLRDSDGDYVLGLRGSPTGRLNPSALACAPKLRSVIDQHQARKMGTRRAALRAQSPSESLTPRWSVCTRLNSAATQHAPQHRPTALATAKPQLGRRRRHCSRESADNTAIASHGTASVGTATGCCTTRAPTALQLPASTPPASTERWLSNDGIAARGCNQLNDRAHCSVACGTSTGGATQRPTRRGRRYAHGRSLSNLWPRRERSAWRLRAQGCAAGAHLSGLMSITRPARLRRAYEG
jgi:hypothetical protein